MIDFSVINLRQSVAEMPTVDFDSEGEELIRRDDVLTLLKDGESKTRDTRAIQLSDVKIPTEPNQTKYERDTLIWMLTDITGETHWVGNAVHFQQQAGELQWRLAGSQRLVESQRDTIRKLRSEEWEARKLLELITDPEPCRLDHHGYCQTHLWVGKDECAHGRAKKLLGETRDTTK